MKKTILITGASSGLGKALADYFAATGHEVYGTSRQAHNYQNESYSMLKMDVQNASSIEQAIKEILQHSVLSIFQKIFQSNPAMHDAP